MHRLLIVLAGGWGLMVSAAAQATNAAAALPTAPVAILAGPEVVQTFEGTHELTTAPFTVTGRWEVRWHCGLPLKISVYAEDHHLVAGTMGMGSGSFFLESPGSYYLEVEEPEGAGLAAAVHAAQGPAGATASGWKIDVVAVAEEGAPAVAATATNAAPAEASPGKLTDAQARAVVLISGDNAEGTGFLVKMADGPAVVTNIHVVADNPHLRILTNTGAEITMTSAKAAADRDLAVLAIKDDGYDYLSLADDVSKTAQTGDEVITPGNSEGGEVMLNTPGKILGLGPERLEIDNPIYHGNSGGPIFHARSGKVLGVVTAALKVRNSDDLDRASHANPNSAIAGSMRYFGLRLDTVGAWVPIDWDRLRTETIFLKEFQDRNLALDSYLNRRHDHESAAETDDGTKLARYYLKDDAIVQANDRYVKYSAGADQGQKLDSLKNLIFDLRGLVDAKVDEIAVMSNFYSFDQERARAELEYRRALKKELETISDNVDQTGAVPH